MDWSGSGGGGGGGEFGMAEDPNEILVFGYACKLFRDDEKALWIDSERHLIPWMGDSSVKIDRYDGRGALMDLSSDRQGTEVVAPLEGGGFMLKETELEKLLEEERYGDLREDSEFDDGNYQEVEFRKFQFDVNSAGWGGDGNNGEMMDNNSYSAVGYCYDQPATTTTMVVGVEEGPAVVEKADDDRPFVKPHGLMLPPNFTVPPTMKLHSIIEKTAKFIASHGNQMEIILKTKQSGNPLFNFLDYKDTLNPYFKFLVTAMRENSYMPMLESQTAESTTVKSSSLPTKSADREGSGSDDDDDDDDNGYLHPSLFSSSIPADTSTSILPPLNFKTNTENSAYSLLVSKIRGSSNSGTSSPPVTNNHSTYDDTNFNGSSYQDYSSSYGTAAYSFDSYSSTNPGDPNSSSSYSSSSSDPNVPYSRPDSEVPNSSDQLVIEKMASYVVKNGPAFEELARIKGDARFLFLNPSHEYHWYYLNCKERFKAESSAVVVNRQFVSYTSSSEGGGGGSNSSTATPTTTSTTETPIAPPKRIILKSVELPLSASGIPIANLESISNRPTSIPPEVASRIELIKKKNLLLFAKKDKESSPVPKIQFSSAIGKSLNLEADENDPGNDHFTQNQGEPLIISSNQSTPKVPGIIIPSTSPTLEITFQPPPAAAIVSSSSSDEPLVPEQSKEEAELLRKQMRRQKAALFLQKLSSAKSSSRTPEETITKTTTTTTDNNNEIVLVDSTKTEINCIPLMADENGKSIMEGNERLQQSHSPATTKEKNGTTTYPRQRSRSKSKSRSRSRSRSYRRSQSSESSFSSHSTISDDSSRKKKRSKRKSTKKIRKKKHERGRSRSSSPRSRKKSKKHKR